MPLAFPTKRASMMEPLTAVGRPAPGPGVGAAVVPASKQRRADASSKGASAATRQDGSAADSHAAPSLLLVDDDPAVVQTMGRMLAALGHLRFALSGPDGLRLARESAPDVMLIDAEMPGMNGFELCAAVKADPQLAEVPVIFVTSHGDVSNEVAGFSVGAADFIRKPPTPEVVLARVRIQLRLKHLTDALRRAALVDGLTGVANRRRFDEHLRAECERAQRSGEPLSLLMIDVDHFKRYNDRYGHPAGDGCLRAVAGALHQLVRRPADQVARYGGEEFTMLLPQTDLAGATHLAERVVEAVAALGIPHADSPLGGRVSVSVGVACVGRTADAAATPTSGSALLAAADRALYAAKAAGRSRVVTASAHSDAGQTATIDKA